jgi:hypothetical protein
LFYLEFIMPRSVLQEEIERIFKIFFACLVLGGAVGDELFAWLGEGLPRR